MSGLTDPNDWHDTSPFLERPYEDNDFRRYARVTAARTHDTYLASEPVHLLVPTGDQGAPMSRALAVTWRDVHVQLAGSSFILPLVRVQPQTLALPRGRELVRASPARRSTLRTWFSGAIG